MKKHLIMSTALLLCTGYSAHAEINIILDEQQPVYYAQPVRGYVMAPDWPSEHYDQHRHRHNDYWARRQQQEREYREHNDREQESHDRRDDYDNGNHGRR